MVAIIRNIRKCAEKTLSEMPFQLSNKTLISVVLSIFIFSISIYINRLLELHIGPTTRKLLATPLTTTTTMTTAAAAAAAAAIATITNTFTTTNVFLVFENTRCS